MNLQPTPHAGTSPSSADSGPVRSPPETDPQFNPPPRQQVHHFMQQQQQQQQQQQPVPIPPSSSSSHVQQRQLPQNVPLVKLEHTPVPSYPPQGTKGAPSDPTPAIASKRPVSGPSASSGGSSSGHGHGVSASGKPIRRRMRMITSCFECRRRKLKCDKGHPCTNCTKNSRSCIYLAPRLDDAGKMRFNEMKEKVGSLERAMERDIVLTAQKQRNFALVADAVGCEEEYEAELHPGDMMSAESIMQTEAELPTGALVDVVLRISRVHLHIRTEALVLARFSSDTLPMDELKEFIDLGALQPPPGQLPAFIKFSPDCVMPFTDDHLNSGGASFSASLRSYPCLSSVLPSRQIGDFLVRHYLNSVHIVCPCLNDRAFERLYLAFWKDLGVPHREPAADVYAMVYAVMFAALMSLSDQDFHAGTGAIRTEELSRLKLAVEASLHRAEYMRGLSFRSLQSLVIYLLAICRTEISRAHSAAVGTALRIAECMGLSKDGEHFRLTPSEIQQRRLVWYQLCFLDIRTSEAQGPRPFLRREDFNTKLPINLTFAQIEEAEATATAATPGSPPLSLIRMPIESPHFTPMILSIVRFEIIELTRAIWWDRQRTEARRSTITEMLSRVDDFRKFVISKYDGRLLTDVPLQRYTRLAFYLQIYRLYVVVLMRYHHPSATPLPQKLNSVLIRACIMIVELTIQLATDLSFAQWRWYIGAYTQYQPALLLAREMFDNPNSHEADRIWPILDFAYNMEPKEPRQIKIKRIMAEIVGKLRVYRELRTPTWMVDPRRAAQIRQLVSDSTAARSSSTAIPVGGGMQGQGQTGPGPGPGPGSQMGHLSNIPVSVFQPRSSAMVPLGIPAQAIPTTDPMAYENWQRSFDPSTGYGIRAVGQAGIGQAEVMSYEVGIDWDIINNIFQHDPITGDLTLEGYRDLTLSMQWRN